MTAKDVKRPQKQNRTIKRRKMTKDTQNGRRETQNNREDTQNVGGAEHKHRNKLFF